MSNYNSIIEQNNTELEGILESVEALPDAENLDDVMDDQESLIDQIQAALEGKAGASVETCTLTVNAIYPQSDPVKLSCILADGSIVDMAYEEVDMGVHTYTLPKPCCIALNGDVLNVSGEYEQSAFDYSIYFINGDVTADVCYRMNMAGI